MMFCQEGGNDMSLLIPKKSSHKKNISDIKGSFKEDRKYWNTEPCILPVSKEVPSFEIRVSILERWVRTRLWGMLG